MEDVSNLSSCFGSQPQTDRGGEGLHDTRRGQKGSEEKKKFFFWRGLHQCGELLERSNELTPAGSERGALRYAENRSGEHDVIVL